MKHNGTNKNSRNQGRELIVISGEGRSTANLIAENLKEGNGTSVSRSINRTSIWIAAVLLLLAMTIWVVAVSPIDSGNNEAAGGEIPQTDNLQLSKEYIYAGSRMLAVEDYGVSETTPTPTITPTPTPLTPTPTPSPALPDLVITNFTLSPTTIYSDDSVNYTVVVQNAGTADTPNNYICVTFLTDGNYNTFTCSNGVLAAGQSNTYTGSFSPTSTAGSHTITAQVDDVNRIPESNEDNNTTNTNLAVNPGPPVPQIDPNAYYRVIAVHSGKCLDIAGPPTNDTAPARQWDCLGDQQTNQQFRFVRVGNAFQIISRYSDKCLDVSGISQADGAIVWQYACFGAAQTNQLWRLIDIGGGNYQIVAKHSNKGLEVAGWDTSTGATIQQWTLGAPGQTNQTWTLNQVQEQQSCTPSQGEINQCEYNGGSWNYQTCSCN